MCLISRGSSISLRSASARPSASPEISAPPASARYSRLREIASWMPTAAIGARINSAATGARPVTKQEYPDFYRVVENLSIAAGLPATPEVRVVDDPAPNAFAAGRGPKHCYVCATTGLLDTMDHRELEGVISHEIAHVQHRDVRLMTLVAVLVGVIALVSDVALRLLFFGGGRRRSSSPADLILLGIGLAG